MLFAPFKKYIASVNFQHFNKTRSQDEIGTPFSIVIWLVKGTFLILYDNLIAATFDELNHPSSYVVSSYLSCPIYNICPK